MKSPLWSWLLICLLGMSSAAYAEGGCPPGMIPHSGNDLSSCAPIPPGYNQSSQPAGSRWISSWGAIATDVAAGSLGTATGKSSRKSAEQAALGDCQAKGGSNCKIENWYSNGCAAMVVGDKGHNSGSGATMEETVKSGMKICNSSDTNCRVFYSGCSLPEKLQ
jgi:Domain of unknown function (DUF4189)